MTFDMKSFAKQNATVVANIAAKIDSGSVKEDDKIGGGGKRFFSPGYYEDVNVTMEIRRDKDGNILKGANDNTFVSTKVTFEKDGKEINEFILIPTTTVEYGINKVAMPFLKFRQLLECTHCFNVTIANAKLLGVILIQSDGTYMSGKKCHIHVGFGDKNHLECVEKGVWKLNIFDVKAKKMETLEPDFPDKDAALAYAKDNGIVDVELFPKVLRIEKSTENVLDYDTAEGLASMGVELPEELMPKAKPQVAPPPQPAPSKGLLF